MQVLMPGYMEKLANGTATKEEKDQATVIKNTFCAGNKMATRESDHRSRVAAGNGGKRKRAALNVPPDTKNLPEPFSGCNVTLDGSALTAFFSQFQSRERTAQSM